MFSRREFGVAGLSGLALAALPGVALAQEDPKARAGEKHETLEACAAACCACQRECDLCTTHCAQLMMEGMKEHLATLMSCRDCATICAAAARVVAGHGTFSALICESCMTACAECAQVCEKHPDDKLMKDCGAECRNCEKACREMLKHSGRKVL
jgi:hypothetical protein